MAANVKNYTLKYVLGICNEYKRFHGEWPTHRSKAEQFLEARIQGMDGTTLNAIVRTGAHGLSDDPEYQKHKALVMRTSTTIWEPDLSTLDPSRRRMMPAAQAEQLFDDLQITVSSSVRRESRPAGHLWVRLPDDVVSHAYERAGVDRRAAQKQSLSFSAYIPASAALLEHISEIGMVYGATAATAGEAYFLDLTENGRLWIKYQTILGSRYVADATPTLLDTLHNNLAAQLQRAFKGQMPSPKPAAEDLTSQLALLTAREGKIELPAQHLSRYAEIKALLEKAGGRYVGNKKWFVFDAGIDTAEVLDKLQSGQTVNLKKDYQFFATQPQEARGVCEAAGPLKGKRVLEPSAGDGAIALVAREMGAKEVVTVEMWNVNALKLRERGFTPIERDFLTVTPKEIGYFDVIVANPPFHKNMDIKHLMHMFNFLKPGGSLSVIMSTGWQSSMQKAHVEFREFLATQNVSAHPIEAGAFDPSGTSVPTIRLDFADYQIPVMRQAQDVEDESADVEAPSMA